MRYDNWDVILFPRNSLVPIQEFRTTYYTPQDEQGSQLPTLTCHISSLPASTPFRISIHSWATPAKPSAVIESQKKTGQSVVYTVQVVIDGAKVFHEVYDITSKWPQEIAKEQRSITEAQIQSDDRGAFLEFPPFPQDILMQRSWDAREHSGRIKILLSEQLMSKTHTPGELNLGAANEIVCFAFQHAPRGILEQAGIAWPIRNPLYMPLAVGSTNPSGSQILMSYVKTPDCTADSRVRPATSSFARPRIPEPYSRPRTDSTFHTSQFPKLAAATSMEPKVWKPYIAESFDDTFDDLSTNSGSAKRTDSYVTADVTMFDISYVSPRSMKPGRPRSMTKTQQHCDPPKASWPSSQPRQEKQSSRQAIVSLRDEKMSQLVKSLSPPKDTHPAKAPQHSPPRMADSSTRPSATALARKASCQRLNTTNDHRQTPKLPGAYQLSCSSEKENCPLSAEARLPTPHPFVSQVPMATWDSDSSMKDGPSVFLGRSSLHAIERQNSPAHVPSARGKVNSKKKAISAQETCHDQTLLSDIEQTSVRQDTDWVPDVVPVRNSPRICDETMDAAAAFLPGHRGGVSSIDSTGRLERQLFSALGGEFESFDKSVDTVAPISGLDDTDAPLTKRKRQGTFGDYGDRSPMTKMVREAQSGVEQMEMPHLRGGE